VKRPHYMRVRAAPKACESIPLSIASLEIRPSITLQAEEKARRPCIQRQARDTILAEVPAAQLECRTRVFAQLIPPLIG